MPSSTIKVCGFWFGSVAQSLSWFWLFTLGIIAGIPSWSNRGPGFTLAVGSKFAFGSFGASPGGKKLLVSSEIFTYAGGLIIP